jgi:UDP-N-acetylglucosamine 2-epimerase (non-hydrolysing)
MREASPRPHEIYRELARGVDLSDLPTKSIAVVFGTRPEIIKLAGVLGILRDRAYTIYSGQHFEASLSRRFFSELDLPVPDVILGVGGRTRGQQIAGVVQALEGMLSAEAPLALVVQGDTNTTAGAALAANALTVPLVHIEAGLRSFDRRMPEEHNRVVADHLADVCLAPTDRARGNLLEEGIPQERIAVTGNTIVDMAAPLVPGVPARARLLREMGLRSSGFALATFHRPENVDDESRLRVILEQLASVGTPVILPIHPRTRRRIAEFGLGQTAAGLLMIPPMGYQQFLALAAECAFLITDSGGLQEEASILKRPVLVVRRSTERPEILGSFAALVPDLSDIGQVARGWLAEIEDRHRALGSLASPYGDGRASRRCVNHLLRLVSKEEGRIVFAVQPATARKVSTLDGPTGDGPPPVSDGSDPFSYSKVASLDDLESARWVELFDHCEQAQADFLDQDHLFRSEDYPWPRDALHSWSRVWEYPYVLYHLRRWRAGQPADPGRVLDFGSGLTFFPFMLAREGFRVWATDIDPICRRDFERALARVRVGPGDVAFRLASQDRIPFGAGTFSAVYSISVLEHVAALERTVAEFARVLEPGGLLVLTLDLSFNESNQLVPERYEQLRSLLDQHFQPAATERVTHPARILRNTNGLYPMYSGGNGVRSLMRKSLRIPAYARRKGLGAAVRRGGSALKAAVPVSAAARYDLACQGLVLRRAR